MLKDILVTQKRDLERKLSERYVKRDSSMKSFGSELIKVIIGPRRSGKSFFAIHNTSKKKSCYINFDDERLSNLENLDELIDTAKEVFGNPEVWIFDEIQNLDKWELFVNRLQRQGLNLIITGSNSNLLSKELSSHLTGRYTSTIIFPFSFKEFVSISNESLTESETVAKFSTYLEQGGFPETILKDIDSLDYLKTLFDSVIYKDIIKRYNVRLPIGISDIVDYLISNIASEYSYNNLAKMTGIKSVHTVQKYVEYIEEAFLFFKLSRFSFKKKTQITSNKKIYCIDNGFVNSMSGSVQSNKGKLIENLIAIELYKKSMAGEHELYFWKNDQKEEIDFIIKKGRKIESLIQVCYDIRSSKTFEREIRALVKASAELKCKNLILINLEKDSTEEISWNKIKAKIKFIPAWKWLLENS